MVEIRGTMEELRELFLASAERELKATATRAGKRAVKEVVKKVKRAPSAYNKRYSAEYKRLAKKHPRLKFAALSKRTHKALRGKK